MQKGKKNSKASEDSSKSRAISKTKTISQTNHSKNRNPNYFQQLNNQIERASRSKQKKKLQQKINKKRQVSLEKRSHQQTNDKNQMLGKGQRRQHRQEDSQQQINDEDFTMEDALNNIQKNKHKNSVRPQLITQKKMQKKPKQTQQKCMTPHQKKKNKLHSTTRNKLPSSNNKSFFQGWGINYNEDFNDLKSYLQQRRSLPKIQRKKITSSSRESTNRRSKGYVERVLNKQEFDKEEQILNKEVKKIQQKFKSKYQQKQAQKEENSSSSSNIKVSNKKRKPKQMKEKRKNFAQQLVDLIFNRKNNRLPHQYTNEEHWQSLVATNKILTDVGYYQDDKPPYYARIIDSRLENENIIKKKIELKERIWEHKQPYPILFPHKCIMTAKELQRMEETIELGRNKPRVKPNPQKPQVKKVFQKIQEKQDNDDSFDWYDEDQSQKYVVQKVQEVIRDAKSWQDYYSDGFYTLFEQIAYGTPQMSTFMSIHEFNKANMSLFTNLDRNYYRALDDRNIGFSGDIQIDEEYEESLLMAQNQIFPQLYEMFNFPVISDDTVSGFEVDGENDNDQNDQNHYNLGNNPFVNPDNRRQNFIDYDQEVMQQKDFEKLTDSFVPEIKAFKAQYLSTPFYDKYRQKMTNLWDLYVTSRENDSSGESILFDEYSKTKSVSMKMHPMNKRPQIRSKVIVQERLKQSRPKFEQRQKPKYCEIDPDENDWEDDSSCEI